MKYEFAGRYEWRGVFIDPDDGHEVPFCTFADDWKTASIQCQDMPGEVVFLERGQDVSDVSLPEVNPELSDFLEAQHKKTIN